MQATRAQQSTTRISGLSKFHKTCAASAESEASGRPAHGYAVGIYIAPQQYPRVWLYLWSNMDFLRFKILRFKFHTPTSIFNNNKIKCWQSNSTLNKINHTLERVTLKKITHESVHWRQRTLPNLMNAWYDPWIMDDLFYCIFPCLNSGLLWWYNSFTSLCGTRL